MAAKKKQKKTCLFSTTNQLVCARTLIGSAPPITHAHPPEQDRHELGGTFSHETTDRLACARNLTGSSSTVAHARPSTANPERAYFLTTTNRLACVTVLLACRPQSHTPAGPPARPGERNPRRHAGFFTDHKLVREREDPERLVVGGEIPTFS